MEEKVFVYGDEFGTSHLDINSKGNISHFLYASLVIEEKELSNANKVRNYISQKYFSGNKIKSNSKSVRDSNFDKRLEILNYLVQNLEFKIHLIVGDKKLIKSKGLEFKEVFYKYFQRMFVSNIISEYERFEIYAHRIISDEYSLEMYKYLDNKLNVNNLFSSYKMVDDADEVLVQLTDIVVGSLGRVFSFSNYHQDSYKIIDILKSKMDTPEYFPYKNENNKKISNQSFKIDDQINSMVLNDVIEYINNSNNDILKIDLLKYFYFMHKISAFNMIETYEILETLNLTYKSLSKEQLRLLIRDLRYEGIMIVSAVGKSGYKLACNEKDIYNYFNHYLKYVEPMLKKVVVADERIKLENGDNNSILNNPDFRLLKHLIQIYDKH